MISTHPSTDPTHNPKRHPDPISRFATVHYPDTQRQTDQPTDRHMGYATGPYQDWHTLSIDHSDVAATIHLPDRQTDRQAVMA